MARSGPAVVEIQFGTVGSAVTLPDCYVVSGGEVTAETTDTTAFGDEIKSKGATGVREVGDITIRGPFDPDNNTAFTLIGRPDTSPGATVKELVFVYQSGVSRSYRVLVAKNDPVLEQGKQTEFEAMFYQAAGASTDLVEDFTP